VISICFQGHAGDFIVFGIALAKAWRHAYWTGIKEFFLFEKLPGVQLPSRFGFDVSIEAV